MFGAAGQGSGAGNPAQTNDRKKKQKEQRDSV
jgi:hypothetical protein